MINKYSLCFQPDETTIDVVKQMKLKLAEAIGWYNSKNALAHITIVEFKSDSTGINKMAALVEQLCATYQPVKVTLDHFGQYPNGAFFLGVDPFSKPILQDYAKNIQARITVPNSYKNSEPHLSIARKLNTEKLSIAQSTFDQPAISFICEQVALRQFNPERGQYDIISIFPFLNLPSSEPEQLSLF
ncbi:MULTISPECIES: 2'-5' RNA ligase family protein [Myroides]|uniref:2'-5' RNA ligase family protein n=1 Tax=Myroides albus TaxID=2562892 RepID=A0A6I3LHQ5_9FLAO|nr:MULTISPECIES: 2'-5' RNA ligase family protein [Myroides]MTG96680.1 2'-5' RNA ligase family protein [Myroides albus]MVX34692.1 2'-5' RNA ligase family protein [Myroides sp. LoEW2-1]UVD80908.1 2'-5' RNA ligase family protein [Myroides albus]